MKLCRIALNFLPEIGGSAVHIMELSRNLAPYIDKQYLVTKKYHNEKYNDREYEKSSGLLIYREDVVRWLPEGRLQMLSFIPRAIRRVLWLNRKYGVDVIQAHCVYTGIAAFIAGKILKIPVIWMAHGTDEAYGRIQGITETLITRIFRPNHLFVLDDGSNSVTKFRRILGDSNVTRVYHGIETDRFTPEYKNDELKEKLKIKNNFVVCSTSLLIPVKNVDYAIMAFSKFLKIHQVNDAVVLIIGAGPLKKNLEKLSQELGLSGKVKFLGKIEHKFIRDYLSVSDVIIATSFHSNVNRSTLEAMAMGKPLLAFDSGNTKNTYTHLKNCLLARTGDIDDLANQLFLLYKNASLRQSLGREGREFVLKNRSWKSRIKKELKIFKMLLGES